MIQAAFIIGLIAIIAIFDVWLIKTKGKKASLSAVIIRISYQFPSLVFIFALGLGFVFGHLFWRMKTLDIYECNAPEVQEIINTCTQKEAL